ncbi:SRR1-like protein isoform X2 [Conger conger]|nr:SRR1-like protein isoform X2 [Conger conger]XP_061117194.1 SRR1-like protein isoform X2 [Conger conger]
MANSGGEWQRARRRKGAARREKQCQADGRDFGNAEDKSRIQRRIAETVAELRGEEFWLEWKELLSRFLASEITGTSENKGTLENDSSLRSCGLDCVCYGLGSFSACVSARYQLAMLILLLDTLRVPPVQCSMFDPVFTPAECEVLQALGFTVLTENEEGKRPVSRPTLFYLIHCGKALYNNLLWRNWSPRALPLLTIVGNSFHSIQERMVRRDLKKNYSFISDVIGACEEMTLPCSPRFLDVFSDTALLRFPPQRLASLHPHTWTQASEPDYQHCEDLEIIQRDQGQPTPTHLDTSL